MKFIVSMKDPDTLIDAIETAVTRSVVGTGLSSDEEDLVIEQRKQTVYTQCAAWFRYGEYLDVEIDTEAGTCTVVRQN